MNKKYTPKLLHRTPLLLIFLRLPGRNWGIEKATAHKKPMLFKGSFFTAIDD